MCYREVEDDFPSVGSKTGGCDPFAEERMGDLIAT
jgi:hypothetical protein